MIEHVFRRAQMCTALDDVIIATPDDEIRDAAKSFGARAVLTSHDHTRASDRVAEAVRDQEVEIVVMLQGDEPMITPEMIEHSLGPFATDPSVQCVNLAAQIRSIEEHNDPNTVKVVSDTRGDALYFREHLSREHLE